MEISKLLQNCRVYTAVQTTTELLPQKQPAIYAFYEALDFSRGELPNEVDAFVTKNGRFVAMRQDNWPFDLRITFRGNPDRFKGEGLRLSKELNQADLPSVREHLLFLSFFNEPLYIGKTEDLKVRFRAHNDNGFLWKMKNEFQRPPGEFVLMAYFCEEGLVRLIESVLIQAINPAFCDQKS